MSTVSRGRTPHRGISASAAENPHPHPPTICFKLGGPSEGPRGLLPVFGLPLLRHHCGAHGAPVEAMKLRHTLAVIGEPARVADRMAPRVISTRFDQTEDWPLRLCR